MEIFERLRIFRSRWVILVLILGVAFGSVGYVIRSRQAPVYQATARLLVGSYIKDERPTPQDVQLANDLTKTYAQLLATTAVRQGAILAFDLHNPDGTLMTPEQLQGSVKVTAEAEIPFINIVASAPTPDLAAKKANALAQQLLLESPLTPSIDERSQQASLQSQIKDLNALRITNRTLLKILDNQRLARDGFTAPDPQLVDSQRLSLTNNLIQISDTLASLENALANSQSHTNSIRVVEPARAPAETSGGSKTIVLGLGFIAGSLLGAGLLLLADELFPSLNSPQRFKRLSGLPMLGLVPRLRMARKPSADWLVVDKQPLSPAAEAYRRVYTQLHHKHTQDDASVYVFNSPHTGEGKSVTAANFAVMLASAGYKVLIIDANLRHPVLHQIFDIDETVGGLSRLLDASPDDLKSLSGDALTAFFQKYIQESNIANVFVLPRGKVEDERNIASLLLRLPQLQGWLGPLHEGFGLDAFVFDTAAYTTSAEALLLADAFKGDTVLVMETRGISRQQAQEIVDQLHQTQTRLVGAVLNKQ